MYIRTMDHWRRRSTRISIAEKSKESLQSPVIQGVEKIHAITVGERICTRTLGRRRG
jgi:hypothetical protein